MANKSSMKRTYCSKHNDSSSLSCFPLEDWSVVRWQATKIIHSSIRGGR